jgi:hypothetical protein
VSGDTVTPCLPNIGTKKPAEGYIHIKSPYHYAFGIPEVNTCYEGVSGGIDPSEMCGHFTDIQGYQAVRGAEFMGKLAYIGVKARKYPTESDTDNYCLRSIFPLDFAKPCSRFTYSFIP